MAKLERIRVLLVDDHPMVRRGLAAFLSVFDDLELVGEAGDAPEAIRVAARVQPDVVLMDLRLPGMDGASATASIRRQLPQSQVIALTSFREDELLRRVIQAGAIGYLLKNVGAANLAAAIRAAHSGQPTFAPEVMPALLNALVQGPAPGTGLSEREREVLALMAKGLSNAAIATQLIVSPSTIRGHVSNILAKLGATSRTEAVAQAMQLHLIH